ncbi:MAG: hypothetical protein HYY02_11670 [Chloroflexi bacterium]|nr:hypothetical protein [Chloroflexota bacterium]
MKGHDAQQRVQLGQEIAAWLSLAIALFSYLTVGLPILYFTQPDVMKHVPAVLLMPLGFFLLALLPGFLIAPILLLAGLLLAMFGAFGGVSATKVAIIALILLVPLVIFAVITLPGAYEEALKAPL